MVDTKTKILNVAESLIQQVGTNAMSYQHISDSVGVRKASIHHHFPKKEHLIEALLERCHISYGENYRTIVDGPGTAPEKLRRIAAVFADGLQNQKLCLVATISSDLNTLSDSSQKILETTIQETVKIYTPAFQQGQQEGSLSFGGRVEETAYAFFSLLLGAQISARASGGVELFYRATEAMIMSWES
jgi:TetR/AcrR family transcriptional regulator, transcriptional repressor for nem operon